MKERPHNLYLMCRWQPPYTPIEPSTDSELPPPLQDAGKLKRAA
jgi:hypothetical protein